MKTKIYTAITLCCAILLSVSCGNGLKNKTVEAADSQKIAEGSSTQSQPLIVNLTTSTVNWKGFKPGGSHHGTLIIKSGELSINNSQLESGTFIFDMNGIICQDITDKSMNEKLVGHLKSPDFFDVAKYPEGKFTITKVDDFVTDSTTHKISGNLQLKDVEKNISFPANITKIGNVYKAVVKPFSIDRTQWNINYGSKNIFKNLKDAFINDNIEISIVLETKS